MVLGMKRCGIASKFLILFCIVSLSLVSANSVRTSNAQPTGSILQLCLLLDGSSSLNGADWNTTRDSLANLVTSTIPRNGSVELAVVEFGYSSSDGYAKVVVTPTVVTETDYGDLSNQVKALNQPGSGISTPAGIDLAWLAMKGSVNFGNSSRHVINLITEYYPAVRNYDTNSDLDQNGVVDAKDDAIAAMTAAAGQGLNELDVEGIGMDNTTAQWFQHYVVWPQVGIIAPPFTKAGWIRTVSNATEFANTISQDFPSIVPELPLTTIIPIFIAATLLAVLIRRKRVLAKTKIVSKSKLRTTAPPKDLKSS